MICPSCNVECDDVSAFCQSCGRKLKTADTPWLLLGCPLTILLLVALGAIVGLLLKDIR